MANRLLITVFTPTYNRVDKLHRAYDSIKSQTLTPPFLVVSVLVLLLMLVIAE